MNEKSANSLISEKSSKAVTQRDVAVETTNSITKFEDAEIGTSRSTYESLYWLLNYTKMFTTRLAKDMIASMLSYFNPGRPLPNHIEDLLRVQKTLHTEHESHTTTYLQQVQFDEALVIARASLNIQQLSETSLDVYIPSFPGSPRSLLWSSGSETSTSSDEEVRDPLLQKFTDYLHEDNNFLLAAETGNLNLLKILIRQGAYIQGVDQLGRTALHLGVCSGNHDAVKYLLEAGVLPNVKDQVGMTPLSLSLMRSPSIIVTNLLFDFGAKLLPRSTQVDTGLFLQFVMMTIPTNEEERILKLLVEKGGLIDDPEAPGGRQALHFAAMSNNCCLIQILVNMGANLFNVNHRNETPKDVAWTFGCTEAYNLLQQLENLRLSAPNITLESNNV